MTFKTDDYFPLLNGYITALSTDYVFDETDKSLGTAGQYGVTGWDFRFKKHLDFSAYNYLVAEFESIGNGYSLQLFNSDIWYGSIENLETGLTDKVVMDLNAKKSNHQDANNTEENLNKADIWAVTFTCGENNGETKDDVTNKIVIKRIYLTTIAPDIPSGNDDTEVTVPGIDDSGEDAF